MKAGPSPAEGKIMGNLLTRARNWRDVEPWYPDQTRGIPKTSESRAIEAVLEEAMYDLVHERLPECTIVSVGHRSTLRTLHTRQLTLLGEGRWEITALVG